MESREFKPGDVLKHFKRDLLPEDQQKTSNDYLYEVICIARHTETNELMLVYKALYGDNNIYTRPLAMAMEEAPRDRYPEEIRCKIQKYRLQHMDSNN